MAINRKKEGYIEKAFIYASCTTGMKLKFLR